MQSNHTLAINFDEISDDFATAASLMSELDIKHGELRTINKKNFVYWSDSEIEEFKKLIHAEGITLVAAATPLFKWYESSHDSDVRHDSFGFNPRLNLDEKYHIIERTMRVANMLEISRLRIFSELKSSTSSEDSFASSDLLSFALQEAAKYGIDLLIENEPVCRIRTKTSIVNFLNANQAPNLKLWLDIANLLELNEVIDDQFLNVIASRIGYIHVKDYVFDDGIMNYVPAGEGTINYSQLLPMILDRCPRDVAISVETHAKANKVEASRRSLQFVKKILHNYRKGDLDVGEN